MKNSFWQEKQITFDTTYHHDLDNNDNFSPDGKWLVYDTRTDEGGIPESARIERVNIETREIEVLYSIPGNQPWGPGAGAVSYSPVENAVVFIHGLPHCTRENPYQQWRRSGVIIRDNAPDQPIFMDARNITAPFTPGALRGGTHRHEWSGDGKGIGFTYNDAVLKQLEDATGEKRNLRTIGVSTQIERVSVLENDENIAGTWFSVLVVRVVPDPKPGSDEISHAAGDSWVGTNGYQKADGTRQLARAFLGNVINKAGQSVPEVFIVDIPEDITIPGPLGPLEGTETDFPMPPKGAFQRRLTFTAETKFPGCGGIVRTSPDGSQIVFLAKDHHNITQLFTISPFGGNAVQVTEHNSDVTGYMRWHPGGQQIAYVWNRQIAVVATGAGVFEERIQFLTPAFTEEPTALVWSPDGKMLAFNRITADADTASRQIFILESGKIRE